MTTLSTLQAVSDEQRQAWNSETMLALLADYLDMFGDDSALRFYLESRCAPEDPANDQPAYMTDAEYVAVHGIQCPVCGSTEIEGNDTDMGGQTATQEISCLACESTWVDVYKLIGYDQLSDNSPEPEDDDD
jgi:formate dehydrogenase maturation protein FdhE